MRGRRQRRLQAMLGLVAMGVALVGLWPALRHVPHPPSPSELAQLCGPLRTLPVPFLWLQWARARDRHDRAASAATGRLLAWLLPEREDLFVGFAWELAYDAAQGGGVEAQLGCLVDALDLLEQGRRLHPASALIARTAAFMLRDRCDASLDDDPERRAARTALGAAFEARAGRGPLEVAMVWLEMAPREPSVPFGRDLQYALTAQLLALERMRAGDAGRATLLLERAAATFDDPERRSRLKELAAWLRQARPGEPPPESLRTWLREDSVLGRDVGVWIGR